MTQLQVLPAGHISATQLNMFQRCGKQYEFRYVQGLKEPPALKPSAGKAGHAGIEAHMRAKIRTGEDPAVDVILDNFDTSWRVETEVIQLQPEDPTLDFSKDDIADRLRTFHGRDAPLIQPRAIEQQFLLPLILEGQALPNVKGYIDILKVPLDGPPTLDLDDYKFVFPGKNGRIYTKNQDDIDWSDQITIYDMALGYAGIRVDRMGLTTLTPRTPTAPPKTIPLYRSPELMADPVRKAMHTRLIRKILAIVSAIRSGTFIATNNPRTCSWCGYRKICPDSLAKDDFLAQQIRKETPA